jgi:DNA mismatch repair protein MutL
VSKVKILDDAVVNQIAAGEVVERPSSVVKELVENSLDAGADEITVVIANGGKNCIEVLDNGSGMLKDDALLAIERFGTSKITSSADLEGVATLGFRGEALPSIASISRLTLITRAKHEPSSRGVRIEISGGVLTEVLDVDSAVGTRIEVLGLFFNVPARRKFLRADSSETGLIRALLGDLAVSHPEVRFSLVSDGVELDLYLPTRSFDERVRQLGIVRGSLLSVDAEKETESGRYRIAGRLSQPINCVSGSGKLRLVVNGRVVRDRLLLKAVRDGYGAFLKGGKYPAGVVLLTCPPRDVDVNVHPQKTEVRFRDTQAVFSLVRGSISRALSLEVPTISGEQAGVQAASEFPKSVSASSFGVQGDTENPRRIFRNSFAPSQDSFRFRNSSLPVETNGVSGGCCAAGGQFRYIGQVFDLYLLFQGDRELIVVDMHAAHERITFYRLKQQLMGAGVASQVLLVPETIDCPPDRQQVLAEVLSMSSRLGIDAEPFGEGSIIVRALPALLGAVSSQVIFDDLFSMSEWSELHIQLEARIDAAISRLACHGSVRSGRKLKEEEAYALLDSLAEVEASAFCPHGRPVSISLGAADLEGMFGRG